MADTTETDANWYGEEAATFGDRLVAAREGAALSQKELAARIGVKQGTLRNWEDDLSEPRANRLTLMAGMLGVSMGWLMTGEGEGPEASEGEVDADVLKILSEMRDVRTQMLAATTRLGQLEKKLRNTLRAAE